MEDYIAICYNIVVIFGFLGPLTIVVPFLSYMYQGELVLGVMSSCLLHWIHCKTRLPLQVDYYSYTIYHSKVVKLLFLFLFYLGNFDHNMRD